MFNKKTIAKAIGTALLLPVAAMAEVEVSGYLKNETAAYVQDGAQTGLRRSLIDDDEHNAGDLFKFQNQARFFVNGDIGESSTWHADVNIIYNTEAKRERWRGHRWYSQYDWLRELYVDTSLGDWLFRLGKQQVVWGTADGIKLLDIINPTDFRFLMQDNMEDSRIPIWMVNAETDVGETGNVQLIVSQVAENQVPGINDGGKNPRFVRYGAVPPTMTNPFGVSNDRLVGSDSGQPFILLGADTITGAVNGFLNIGAAMGGVTTTFYGDGMTQTFTNPLGGLNPGMPEFASVGAYTQGTYAANPANQSTYCAAPDPNGISGAACLKQFTELTNQNITNLTDADPMTGAGWDPSNPNSTWEFMPDATFATFNAFQGMSTRYDRDLPDNTSDANFGGRYKANLDNGLNFSLNYFYAYDANPAVDIHWADPVTGERLQVVQTPNGIGGRILQLKNSAGQFYGAPNVDFSDPINAAGATDVVATSTWSGRSPELVFEETQNRIHNLGGSFDYALDTDFLGPIVLRGELLYQKDVKSPIIDRYEFSNGNLTEALKLEKGDWFKYVLGADITVAKNLLISGQFIQFRNLDYKNETIIGANGQAYARYTGDRASMHLTNGLQRDIENREFYSLFLSKPFGPSQEHRVNNIFIYEEGGGKWNRFDVEYTFMDELIGTFAWNHYWGDEDTLFGQFEKSSNIQVGLKYLF
jgi:hypothetical protein